MMREFCFKHQLLRDAGEQCGRCAAETGSRDTLNVLESRIADLEDRLLRTNRILAELVKRFESMRRAHNALARHSDQVTP